MLKIGDVEKMSDEENAWGMWDGHSWNKVYWIPLKQAWCIPDDILKRMLAP